MFDMKKPWLLLDTSCQQGIVAVFRNGLVCAQHALPQPRQHAETLTDSVLYCLQHGGVALHELAGVAVGQGPGSFVGVRIAMAHAKGIACALGIGVVGIPTLLALAAGTKMPLGHRVLVLLDARRAQVFAQQVLYVPVMGGKQAIPVAAGAVAAVCQQQVVQQAKQVDCVLACQLQQAWLEMLPGTSMVQLQGPTAAGMGSVLAAHLAQEGMPHVQSCEQLRPVYVRSPDARLPNGGVV